MAQTLVLGVGNPLLTDEGVGIHVIRQLQHDAAGRPGLRVLDGGTLSFTLLPELDGLDNLIVVDAAQLDAKPGTVRCFVNGEMDHMIGTGKRSAHEVGLLDLLTIVRLTGQLPSNRALVAVQPAVLDWGDSLSEAVRPAVARSLHCIEDLLLRWGGDPTGRKDGLPADGSLADLDRCVGPR